MRLVEVDQNLIELENEILVESLIKNYKYLKESREAEVVRMNDGRYVVMYDDGTEGIARSGRDARNAASAYRANGSKPILRPTSNAGGDISRDTITEYIDSKGKRQRFMVFRTAFMRGLSRFVGFINLIGYPMMLWETHVDMQAGLAVMYEDGAIDEREYELKSKTLYGQFIAQCIIYFGIAVKRLSMIRRITQALRAIYLAIGAASAPTLVGPIIAFIVGEAAIFAIQYAITRESVQGAILTWLYDGPLSIVGPLLRIGANTTDMAATYAGEALEDAVGPNAISDASLNVRDAIRMDGERANTRSGLQQQYDDALDRPSSSSSSRSSGSLNDLITF